MKNMKKIIPVLCILILVMIFSACNKNEKTIEDCEWKLQSATSFKNQDEVIKFGDTILRLNDGAIAIEDITNDKTFNGAYEEMYETDIKNDYKVIIEGATGYMELSELSEKDKDNQVLITIDQYDLYFVENK